MLWVAPGSALLLALLADARLMVWDVAAGQVQVEASAAPLLTGPGAAGLRGEGYRSLTVASRSVRVVHREMGPTTTQQPTRGCS